jgi:hypothetical protein
VHVRPQVKKIKPRLNEEKSEYELDDEKVEYYETNAGCSV